jgi:cell fate regulator YaaT (PSP1 superfamily)
MAKAQRLSLNPGAISGMCGRLKCCLCYEYDCYRSLGRSMPRDGAKVVCPKGRGCVVDKDILAQKVSVRLEDDRVSSFHVSEIEVVWKGSGRLREHEERDNPENITPGDET